MTYAREEQVLTGRFTANAPIIAPVQRTGTVQKTGTVQRTATVHRTGYARKRIVDGKKTPYWTAENLRTTIGGPLQAPACLPALEEIGPLSTGSVPLGISLNRLPVLFNLNDPAPGAFLILGDAQSGKTEFLLNLFRSAAHLNPGRTSLALIASEHYSAARFGVSSEYLEIWRPYQPEALTTIQKLARLARRRLEGRPGGPALILGIDDLDVLFASLPDRSWDTFYWLVRNGAAARIWTVATLSSRPGTRAFLDSGLLDAFPTLLLGRLEDPRLACELTGGDELPCSLLPGVEFCLSTGLKASGRITLQRRGMAFAPAHHKWMRFTILRHSLD